MSAGFISYGADDSRQLPAGRILRGQNSEGSQARRPAGGAADEVRVRDQLKTAKQIGVTIPQSVLYRADKVIK